MEIMSELTREEIERYSRQILYSGKKGQLSLKNGRVLVLGAGGIGSALLPYLAASGVGEIRLLEADTIEQSNLSRQILFASNETGLLKGAVARNKLLSLNPFISIDWIGSPFTHENAQKAIEGVDLILEGTDSIECKFLVNDISLASGIPALIGAIGSEQGHLFPVIPNAQGASHGSACYRCLFEAPPENPDEIPTCATQGILSPLAGVIGAHMAYRAVRFFIEKQLDPDIDLMEKRRWRTIHMDRDPSCPYCNKKDGSGER